MIFYPPPGAQIRLWLLYSSCDTGTYIEGAFTNKVQAEAAMRWHIENDRNNSSHWIRELTTEEHES